LLTPGMRARLQASCAEGRVRVALYTARPSLPPAGVDGPTTGYSPEAEAARCLVGLDNYPLIGMGSMRWLAQRVGEEVGRLVKPSPVQALAAVGAAASGEERLALEAALGLCRNSELIPPLAIPTLVMVHVFEDSTGGIAAVESAVAALRAAGVAAHCQAYGIVPSDGPKAEAMAARGVATYPTVNEAVQAALAMV